MVVPEVDPHSRTWTLWASLKMMVTLSLATRWDMEPSGPRMEWIYLSAFEEGSYLCMMWDDERKTEVLSGDQKLAVGWATRDRHEGSDDGARLRVTGSTRVNASVVVTASIVMWFPSGFCQILMAMAANTSDEPFQLA